MPIRGSYGDRFFTYGTAGLEGAKKITGNDFTPIIEKALSLPEANMQSDETLVTGFHHNTVLGIAPEIIDAVKAGKIRRFFVIAGCDAPTKGRDYYRELALSLPQDCVLLTTSCGKFRFNDLDIGEIGGLPRLMDMGQCNDAYSAIQVALALSNAFECGVNDLPLTLVLSWYEQKAVCILMTLLSLGIKNIYLGPTLPAFISPNVLGILVDKFGLKPTTTPEADLKAILG
jgi:hydroxylamine reductase